MNELLTILLETVRYLLPAVIVYLLFRQHLNNHLRIESFKLQSQNKKHSTDIKLQALERLSLFCERMDMSALLLRLNEVGSSSDELHRSLLISIQKEFEHNLTQQIYVSRELWQMIELLKDNCIELAGNAYLEKAKQDKAEYINTLLQAGVKQKLKINEKVKHAIRKETESILG